MKVVSFNIENGGFNTKSSPMDYVKYLKTLNADIICIQESWWRTEGVEESPLSEVNTAQDIAILMNMNFHQSFEPYGCAILSKYPIIHFYDPNKVCGVIVAIGE